MRKPEPPMFFSRRVKLSQARKVLGVHRNTLLNWQKHGLIRLEKSPTGCWFMSAEELENAMRRIKA